MTEHAARHAAAKDKADTLILPAQPWLPDDGDAGPQPPPNPVDRPAGRHAAAAADRDGQAEVAPRVPRQPGPADARVASSAAPPTGVGGDGSSRNGQGPIGPASRAATRAGAPGPDQAAEPAGARPRGAAGSASKLRLVWVYPDLLSTYGDRGNLLVLGRRARLRGFGVEAIEVNSDQRVPGQGDIYLLGGGEDLPQILAASRLQADGGLAAAASGGSVVFAVCAGYQVIGHQFGGVEGEPVKGLGLLDITSGRGERRGVGELVAEADPSLGVPTLTGFENHQGVTTIGPDARPLGQLSRGVGNGDGTEGAYAGKVLGTYMHGPALARNPGLADLLLSWAAGPLSAIDPAEEEWAARLRAERLAAVAQ